jgi:hypothetical protein
MAEVPTSQSPQQAPAPQSLQQARATHPMRIALEGRKAHVLL